MAIYPNSNLASDSQPWGREIEKNLDDVTSQFLSERTNNIARDAQLEASYKRLNATSIETAAATVAAAGAASDAQAAASAAQSAALTANNAATAAASAATAAAGAAATANNAIAILQSLTTTSYYGLQSSSWSYSGAFSLVLLDYYGSTYIDIPEVGGQRRVIVTAIFDVDMRSTTTSAGVGSLQQATARMYGTSIESSNSTFNGAAVFSGGTTNVRNYGGTSLVVVGDYLVSSSGTLSWNPDLTIESSTVGTFSGAGNLRTVTVVITKV